ncbi:MAG: radical SAM protein [Victivallaceae bacterium]
MTSDVMMCVNEEFVSIQGESTHAGRICYFIRFAGCNLRCSYCDTVYAWDFGAGTMRSLDEIVQRVVEANVKLVEITGGEPLLQKNLNLLLTRLLSAGCEILIETNGSCDISMLPPEVKRILDCKLPGSGMSERNLYENYKFLHAGDEIKFVISDEKDYEFSKKIIEKYNLSSQPVALIFSTVFGTITPEKLAELMIRDNVPARLQLQMHKYIWPPERIGV